MPLASTTEIGTISRGNGIRFIKNEFAVTEIVPCDQANEKKLKQMIPHNAKSGKCFIFTFGNMFVITNE